MNDSELKIDLSCHVLYSKECKKQILASIASHCPADICASVWEQVQKKYEYFLSDWRTDLGGKKNFHNGKGGTYDCIALMVYYDTCREFVTLEELENIVGNLILPAFRKLSFVDCNKPFFKKLMYRAFLNAKKQCDKWGDYKMYVAPLEMDKPIYYEFTRCPVAEFAKQHDLLEVMPAMCNPDFGSMELIRARLVRKTTCSNGCKCDYTICGDRDEYLNSHPEYRDDDGYRRNK